MKLELQDEFEKKYPQIFRDMWGDMRETCMAWGICIGEGWAPLIDKLCADIMALDPGPQFRASQIKEKFGGLRFYVGGLPRVKEKSEYICELIRVAEAESYKICEHCGTRDNVTVEGSWIKTLCGNCRSKKQQNDVDIMAEMKRLDERRLAKKNKIVLG